MSEVYYQTDVLIVDGGQVGMSLSLDLRTHGVDFLLRESADTQVDYPSALPGGRAPHARLCPGVPNVDLFSSDFALLSFQPAPHTERFQHTFAAHRVPLRVEQVRDPDIVQLYGGSHVLVRLDSHVAWPGMELPELMR